MEHEKDQETEISKVFDELWEKRKEVNSWDYLSEIIYNRILDELKEIEGVKEILETGSGTGRISLRLAQNGYKTTLLDISFSALKISEKLFKKENLSANLIAGSIFNLPFIDKTFDIVWNAGVVEHYLEEDQKKAFLEMIRICKNDGLIITMNPSANSLIYRAGKYTLEKIGKWEYGFVKPIKSFENLSKELKVKLSKEYSIGFIILFTEFFRRFIPYGSIISNFLGKIFISLERNPGGKFIRWIDKTLSNIFGGYLLVSVIKNEESLI
ncbi:MAG: methyltransferase domain-containing protein [bacterium]